MKGWSNIPCTCMRRGCLVCTHLVHVTHMPPPVPGPHPYMDAAASSTLSRSAGSNPPASVSFCSDLAGVAMWRHAQLRPQGQWARQVSNSHPASSHRHHHTPEAASRSMSIWGSAMSALLFKISAKPTAKPAGMKGQGSSGESQQCVPSHAMFPRDALQRSLLYCVQCPCKPVFRKRT